MTYEHGGKQYVAVLSGVGGWAGIGLAAGLTKPTDGLGAVGGYAGLRNYTALAVNLRCSRCQATELGLRPTREALARRSSMRQTPF
jgi:hypothetical protein